MSGADFEAAIAHYRELAPRYDQYTRRINAIRQRTVAALALQPGETVLDAACGTGYCLPFLERGVGSGGRVLGFEPSPDMLALARARVAMAGWRNATLIEARGEEVRLPVAPDAILFSYAHDLIRSRPGLENLFAQARPGARVAATSTKLYAPWLAPANWYLKASHRAYITNFEGFAAPWSLLAEYLDGFTVQTRGTTQHYIATGRLKSPARGSYSA
jgi:demethylmenaquinone methyltransferase/2-methoxy-6-polyprenyl-1,4-benzoquinol methylase